MQRILLAALSAASLALANTTLAGDKAYFSAQYGGWSKEANCWGYADQGTQSCRVLTIGKGNGGDQVASLSYQCTGIFPQMYIAFIGSDAVDDEISAFEVRWDGGDKEKLAVRLTVREHRGKPLYLFYLRPPPIRRMAEHDHLYVWIPFFKYERPERVQFGMKNAIRSMKMVNRKCGIKTSTLSSLINP